MANSLKCNAFTSKNLGQNNHFFREKNYNPQGNMLYFDPRARPFFLVMKYGPLYWDMHQLTLRMREYLKISYCFNHSLSIHSLPSLPIRHQNGIWWPNFVLVYLCLGIDFFLFLSQDDISGPPFHCFFLKGSFLPSQNLAANQKLQVSGRSRWIT